MAEPLRVPRAIVERCETLWPGSIQEMERRSSPSEMPFIQQAVHILAGKYGMEIHAAHYEAPVLAAAMLWRKNPRVYRFHGAFSDSLNDYADAVSAGDAQPFYVLRNLPERCFYLHAPNAFSYGIDGCFCLLSGTGEEMSLDVIFPICGTSTFSASIRLDLAGDISRSLPSLESLLEHALVPARNGHAGALGFLTGSLSVPLPFNCPSHNSLLRVLQHCFYLTSAGADVVPGALDGVTDVGYHIPPPESASAVPAAVHSDGAGGGGPKRSHMRRAHWHNYWIRNEAGAKVLTPKWIAAVYVSGGEV